MCMSLYLLPNQGHKRSLKTTLKSSTLTQIAIVHVDSECATMLYKAGYVVGVFVTDITSIFMTIIVRYTARATNLGHMYIHLDLMG